MSKSRKRAKTYRNLQASQQPVVGKTAKQDEYIQAIRDNPQTICMGPAGTGKTYISASLAADALLNKQVDQIIITRPNVGAGDTIGLFPGTLEEKMAPWVAPITSVIEERLGKGHFEEAFGKSIQIVPLEVIRGRDLQNAFILFDEAQNATLHQLKAFVTRQGEDSKSIINGDVRQTDLGAGSGLLTLIQIIKKRKMGIPIVEFGIDDIVRSGICKDWVVAFLEEGL